MVVAIVLLAATLAVTPVPPEADRVALAEVRRVAGRTPPVEAVVAALRAIPVVARTPDAECPGFPEKLGHWPQHLRHHCKRGDLLAASPSGI